MEHFIYPSDVTITILSPHHSASLWTSYEPPEKLKSMGVTTQQVCLI